MGKDVGRFPADDIFGLHAGQVLHEAIPDGIAEVGVVDDDALTRVLHDREYGFPLRDDDALFERLVLEINQAGLSWLTILKKREAFRNAFSNFAIDKVARFSASKRKRLLSDAGIIRNRLKIEAAIENA